MQALREQATELPPDPRFQGELPVSQPPAENLEYLQESGLVQIRRSNGCYEWVTPKELELLNSRKARDRTIEKLTRQRNIALVVAAFSLLLGLAGLIELLRERPRGYVVTSDLPAGPVAPPSKPLADARPAAPELDVTVSALDSARLPKPEAELSGRPQETPQAGGEDVAQTGRTASPDSARTQSRPPAEAEVANAPRPEAAEDETPAALFDHPNAQQETEAIAGTVEAWARAWSRQDAKAYLAFYSAGFQLPDGISRSEWKSARRDRIEAPGFIEVKVSHLETAFTGPESAIARFVQSYRRPGYQDRVEKVLQLVKKSDRWWIVAERSTPL